MNSSSVAKQQPGDAKSSVEASGFTPGPWRIHDVRKDFCDEIWIEADHPEVGAVSHASVRYGCDEAQELGDIEANARLIAAAPDLLQQLRMVTDTLVYLKGDGWETVKRARAAIAKATGTPSPASTAGPAAGSDQAREEP